ncbi:hypothetical protein I7I50_08208 [Histoplasma capsulatum G186AR]|uniref:Uncharacterized protein n=1 Tax=Ajellomyces capsulatus TaxID=5037 RepID=A0A8H7YN59_AJECA|nr:hypothetical protein I7I52_05725 [Histoplasma capsulatum]QSS73431.1 hypothetical protein I7I50_08208 [Histoplasma capsulatum G186AR]
MYKYGHKESKYRFIFTSQILKSIFQLHPRKTTLEPIQQLAKMHYLTAALFTLASLSSIIPLCSGATLHKREDPLTLYPEINSKNGGVRLDEGKCYAKSDQYKLTSGWIFVPFQTSCAYYSSTDCSGSYVRHLLAPGVKDTPAYLRDVHADVNSIKCDHLAPK